MSKVVSKLVKLAVVSSTLAVLGTTMVLPVAYADGRPDRGRAEAYCSQFHGSVFYYSDAGVYMCAYRDSNGQEQITGIR